MSAFANMFSPDRGPNGKLLDPEERFIRMDGGPYFGSAMANMIYKNPQATLGMAISFVAPTYFAATHKFDFIGIYGTQAMAVTAVAASVLLPYFIEQIGYNKRPKLRYSVIDRYGLMPNDQDRYQAAIKTYASRIKLGAAVIGMSAFSALPSILSGNFEGLLLGVGPGVAMSTWSWWAKRKLKNKDWTIVSNVPNAELARQMVPLKARRRFVLLPA